MDKRRQKILRKLRGELFGLALAASSWLLDIAGITDPIISICGVILGLTLAGYSFYQKYYQYEEKMDDFENARPIIIPQPRSGIFPANLLEVGTSTTNSTVITNETITTHNVYDKFNLERVNDKPKIIFGDKNLEENKCWFALVDFINSPIEPTDYSVAREVTAHITYYDKDCKPRIKEDGISGRWWSNEEVALSNKPRRELERTDIFPGTQPVTLALACMAVKESAIYGFNNDNHANKNYQKPEFSLGLGHFYIHVMLAGIHLKPTEFWFNIWRDTTTGELKVRNDKKPSCMK